MIAEAANSVVIVDLKKIKRNIEKIKNHIGPDVELMITSKSNGYGHGLVEPCVYIRKNCNINKFATAMVSEAVQLREAGIDCFIMVFGGIPYQAIPTAVKYNLVASVYDHEFARLLSKESTKQNKITKVHIKIDTGLRRLGVRVGEELQDLLNYLKTLKGIEIEGAFTHLADPDADDQVVTYRQLDIFNKALEQIKDNDIELKYIHAANTGATVRCKESHYNLVRPAALWLGCDTSPGEVNRLGLETALTWKTYVTNVLYVKKGESVSYSNFYVAKKRTKIAILGFGGGDGYVRDLITRDPEKNGKVIINGKKVPLIAMNMDQAYADVTDLKDVKINDEAYLIGKMGDEEITSMDLGKIAGTSNGHILCSIGSRPTKVYKE